MLKKALLIGINYYDTPSAQLNGCINDVVNMRNMLIDAYGYTSENIIVLRDDISNSKPTSLNIMNSLKSLVSQSKSLSEIWIHYSGHGSQIQDMNGDESDSLDEIIVPCDYFVSGFITDDMIYGIVRQSLCKTVLIFDSCNSGTICDLMWNFNANLSTKQITTTKTSNNNVLNQNIICLSGCRDEQSSADVYNVSSQQYCGAITNAIMECLRWNKHNVDVKKLFIDVVSFMLKNGFTQIPQLSSSAKVPIYQITREVTKSTNDVWYSSGQVAIRNVMKDLIGTYG